MVAFKNLALVSSLVAAATATSNATAKHFKATALVTNAHNVSQIECWEFTDPVFVSTQKGTAGAAAFTFPLANQSVYNVIPPRFDGGLHTAPVPQLAYFLSGVVKISLPVPVHHNSSLDEAWIVGGSDALLIAVDTTGIGHYSTYPTDDTTTIVQIPFEDGASLPPYRVASPGPCHIGRHDSLIV